MSGHSKWANIKHKKELNDAKRGALFTKLVRAITMAVKEGAGNTDPASNVALRIAIERAKEANMPKTNIDRAIQKASGDTTNTIREVVYEAIGPGGVACLIPALTDNPNRTSAQVRNVCEKNGGKMAGQGAVSYMFERCGIVAISDKAIDEVMVFSVGEQLNALDIANEHETYVLTIPFVELGAVSSVLGSIEYRVDLFYHPKIETPIDSETGKRLEKFVESLEELDDVEKVYTNETI